MRCHHCGSELNPDATLCANCYRRVDSSVRQGSSGTRIVLIATLVLVPILLFFVIGAVLIIPSLGNLTGRRSKQKRTMADMRVIATSLEAYAVDTSAYPPASSLQQLRPHLLPTYIRDLPVNDGWNSEFRFRVWQEDPASKGPDHYSIISAGRDRKFDFDDFRAYPLGPTGHFDCDIIYSDGSFLQYPDGVQTGDEPPPPEDPEIQALRKESLLRPDDPEAHFKLANLYYQRENYRNSIQGFKEAVRLKPDYALAHARLGFALCELGRFDEAVVALEAATKLDPSDWKSWSNLGLTYQRLGKAATGVDPLRRAVALQPAEAAIRNNLGLALLDAGKTAEAIEEFREAVRLDPKDSMAWSNLARSYWKSGDRAAAERARIELRKIDFKADRDLANELK